MSRSAKQCAACGNLLSALAAGLVPIALAVVFLVAPTEPTMGQAQRIVYVHVAVAWLALAGFMVMAASGGMYLLRRDLAWDHWAAPRRTGLAVLHADLGDRFALGPRRLEYLVDMGSAADGFFCSLDHVLRIPPYPQQPGGSASQRSIGGRPGHCRSARRSVGRHRNALVSRHPSHGRRKWNRG